MGVKINVCKCTRCKEEIEGEPLWVKPVFVKQWHPHCKSCAVEAARRSPRVEKDVLYAFWRKIIAERQRDAKNNLSPDPEDPDLEEPSGGLMDYISFKKEEG